MSTIDKACRRLKLPRDPLLRLLTINGFAGIGIAGLVLAGLFWVNIGNLRVLVLNAANPLLPLLMLGFGLAVTLVSVVIGSAIMLIGQNDPEGGTPLSAWVPEREFKLRPAPAAAPAWRPKDNS